MKISKTITIAACSIAAIQAGGWNDTKDIELGKNLFAKNCAACNGPEGIGPQSPALKVKRKDGKFQPPALNGTAHTWHHAPKLLSNIIAKGGNSYYKGYKGWMPEFQDSLSQKERDATLKYVHSLWPNKIKKMYDKRFSISGDGSGGGLGWE